MAKLFQFSAFIGKLATLLRCFFFPHSLGLPHSLTLTLSLSFFRCSSIILSSCHDYSFCEFASTLLVPGFGFESLSNLFLSFSLSAWAGKRANVCVCTCVCVRFSQFRIIFLFAFFLFYFIPKLFLVLDKVNFNAAYRVFAFTWAEKLHFLNVIFWVDSVYYSHRWTIFAFHKKNRQ